MIEFEVPGKPRPQGSKRHVGNGRMIESSKYVAAWRELVACMADEAMKDSNLTCVPNGFPLTLNVSLFFARPACHYKKGELRDDAPQFFTKVPDLSKVMRSIEDAMTGIVYADDRQLVKEVVTKDWSDRDYSIIRVGDIPW